MQAFKNQELSTDQVPQSFFSRSRRDFLRIGSLSTIGFAFGLGNGFGLADWLRYRRLQAEERGNANSQTHSVKKPAKACILIWLDGGPSHLETFDPKPNAPLEVRGPLESIATKVPGVRLGECLPRTAGLMHKVALIRSVTSPLGEHQFGTHYMMTGYKPTPVLDYPSFGAVRSYLNTQPNVLPNHIAVPHFRVGGAGMTGEGFLPSHHQPFSVGSDPASANFQVRDLDFYPGVGRDRVDRRMQFIQSMNRLSYSSGQSTADRQSTLFESDNAEPGGSRDSSTDAVDVDLQKAHELMTSADAKRAFEIQKEKVSLREAYGGKSIGQCCLLARRLVERGVPFVTVNHKGWDTHNQMVTRLKDGFAGSPNPIGLIPTLDQALGALITDLDERQMLDETLVVVMGEFGRTPKLNTSGGRDHWPRVFSVLMAGGGVAGGQVVGMSDAVGESPAARPVTPSDLAATIYSRLGINPATELRTPDGRPVRLTPHGASVISELV